MTFRTIVFTAFLVLAASQCGAQTIVQHVKQANGSCSASNAITVASTGAHNFIYVGIAMQSSGVVSSVSDNSSDSVTQDPSSPKSNSGNGAVASYYFKNIAGGATSVTVAFSATPNNCFLEVAEVSGLDQASPYDTSCSNTFTSSTTPSACSVTTGNANDILFATIGVNPSSGQMFAATNSYAILDSDSSTAGRGATEDKTVSATGTYPDGWQLGTAKAGAGIVSAFKAAGGAAAPAGVNKRIKLEQIDLSTIKTGGGNFRPTSCKHEIG